MISFCDVLYECMLNSTEKLQINQLLSYLKRVPGALFSVNLIKFNSELLFNAFSYPRHVKCARSR